MKYDSSRKLLQDVGLRPTRQRLALANWLFDGTNRHVTAEQVHDVVRKLKVPVSLATVYNTLNQFVELGLLGQVFVDSGQVYFDTNMKAHHHLFDEKKACLTDTAPLALKDPPQLPPGKVLEKSILSYACANSLYLSACTE